uniref:Death ligand signal enhancer n=1 Tax=Sinocyclocheilus rhinocerous TaxID=307959 RepID=A0A673HAP6_9TELE
NSSILSSGRHASDSSSSHSSHDQKKKRTSQFCYTGLPRYTALDAVGWGAAAVLFMQLCHRIHSRLSSHADQNPGPARIRKCSYKVLIDILSRPNALSDGVMVKCLQTPDSGSSDRSHGNGDGDATSDLQTAHSSDDQQEEPESAASHCGQKNQHTEGVSLDAAAQNLQSVADASVPVILNIIGLESARAGAYETAFSCFLASAQHDYSKAQFNLGVCYEKGRGAQTDLSKVLGFSLSYMDACILRAQVCLGVVLSQRPDCDEKKCVHYFRMAAESGDAAALVCLAQCYETGFGVSPCVQTAVSLYHQAAARGNQRARDVLRDRHSRDVLRSIRSAPCFSVIGQLNLNSMFPQEKPRPQQRSGCQSQPLPHSWSTGSLSVSLQMLSAESSRKVWTLGVR